jgi:Fe-S-cluster-containing hydrogenase component 2
MEAGCVEACARFASECRQVGLPLIIEPLAFGGQVTGANTVELLSLGARMAVELGADALKIPYTGDVDSFRRLVQLAGVPVLVLGGARSDNERDALELFAEALQAGGKGCLMGRNVTKSPDPQALVEGLANIAHQGWTVDQALRDQRWQAVRLKAHPADCTGCQLCLTACVSKLHEGEYGLQPARLRIDTGKKAGHFRVMFCTLCKKCLEVCPEKALRWHPITGAVELLVERCTACGECVEACPTGVILHSETGLQLGEGRRLDWCPVICDLCGGEPECVGICPTGAIFVEERRVIA